MTLAAQTERNDLMRIHQEMLIFTSSVGVSYPVAKRHMSIMREKVTDRLLAFETQSAPRNTVPSTPAAHPLIKVILVNESDFRARSVLHRLKFSH